MVVFLSQNESFSKLFFYRKKALCIITQNLVIIPIVFVYVCVLGHTSSSCIESLVPTKGMVERKGEKLPCKNMTYFLASQKKRAIINEMASLH